TFSYRAVRKDGTRVWFETTSRAVVDPGTNDVIEIVSVSRDISERKRAEEQIEYQAYHDALTGLPNRRLFRDRLTVALAHARRPRDGAGGRRHGPGAAQERRQPDVPREGDRAELVSALRAERERAVGRSAVGRERAAARHRPRRVRAALPAPDPRRQRRSGGHGSALALEPSRSRHRHAGDVHPHRGRDAAD